jgi:putative membrane protein
VEPSWSGRLASTGVIIVQPLVLIVLRALCDWTPIRLRLVPTYVKHAQARHLAHREFHAHFADDKSTRECILFFVSLGEHYVEIIADHETHARVPSNAWNKIVGDFSAAIARSRVADGLLGPIESCGEVLNTHYPRRA